MRGSTRYTNKRIHKRKMEKKFANQWHYGRARPGDVKLLREQLMREAEEDEWWRMIHPPRNGGWEYWKTYSLTGRRQYAKKYSDRRIRQKYRQLIHNLDPEDVTAPRGADYEKEYDYNWTIW